MHASILFKILAKDGNNIFAGVSHDNFSEMRKLIIEMILNTDLARHFKLIGRFKAHSSANKNFDL